MTKGKCPKGFRAHEGECAHGGSVVRTPPCCQGRAGDRPTYPAAGLCDHASDCPSLAKAVGVIRAANARAEEDYGWAVTHRVLR